ncbi:FkbM family methyltransferase [Sulfuricurvum sp.]|uniref:FkbM family methyltransferase n=1 Tax=Sulfuricurvum sp. TaxID=2025608 RepID=UPI00261A7E68|nr:FkbM family methyltransferase [Sulfuricurvum sp.]MDD2780465.1 FkbM family methyltransferase [Sulfuricurvum sp.]
MYKFIKNIVEQYNLNINSRIINNYDFRAYSYGKYIEPDMEQLKKGCESYFSFFILNAHKFFTTYNLLNNNESKKLFVNLILYRSLGYFRFKIEEDYDWTDEVDMFENIKKYYISESSINSHGLYGELGHFENVPFADRLLNLECWSANIVSFLYRKQYYYGIGGVEVKPEYGDIVIDAGACFGDTAINFAATVGDEGHVYTFDPLVEHIEIARHNIFQNSMSEIITVVPCGLGNYNNNTAYNRGEKQSSNVNPAFSLNQNENIDLFSIRTIDFVCTEQNINKIDFIKMDIEGFELEALKGAFNTIKKNLPKLAISLYHKLEDFYEIPDWIKSNFPEYQFYLGHHTIHAGETILYCIAKSHD